MVSQGVMFGQFGDENPPSGAHLGSFGVIWGRFGTQNAPQEPPEEPKRTILGPKSAPQGSQTAILEFKMVHKGGLGRPQDLKIGVLGSKKVLFGPKWGPQSPAFLRGVQKSRLRKVRYLRISEKRETKTLYFYDVGERVLRKACMLTRFAEGAKRHSCILKWFPKSGN